MRAERSAGGEKVWQQTLKSNQDSIPESHQSSIPESQHSIPESNLGSILDKSSIMESIQGSFTECLQAFIPEYHEDSITESHLSSIPQCNQVFKNALSLKVTKALYRNVTEPLSRKKVLQNIIEA